MSYLQEATEKVEKIFAQELTQKETIAAIQELFEKELVDSFKNGIEVGKKRGASQSKDAKKKEQRLSLAGRLGIPA